MNMERIITWLCSFPSALQDFTTSFIVKPPGINVLVHSHCRHCLCLFLMQWRICHAKADKLVNMWRFWQVKSQTDQKQSWMRANLGGTRWPKTQCLKIMIMFLQNLSMCKKATVCQQIQNGSTHYQVLPLTPISDCPSHLRINYKGGGWNLPLWKPCKTLT